MPSTLDKSPDRPDSAPEAAGGDLKRAEHVEYLGPPVYKDKTLWFRSDKVLARISAAEAEVARRGRALEAIRDWNDGTPPLGDEPWLEMVEIARQALENSND